MLTNSSKKISSYIIFETQSTFVPLRLISNNILIAFETLHHMKNKWRGKTRSITLKLDISKAYDRVI